MDQATHLLVTKAQSGIDAASQTPAQNIEANAKLLRDLKVTASSKIDQLEKWAKDHAHSLGF
jgi:hypothetical protein